MSGRRRRRRRPVRRFNGALFGPWALRPMLRSLLEPGEHFVGWGIVQPVSTPWSKTTAATMFLVPVFGPIIAAIMASSEAQKRRLAVLTERRLIMVRADAQSLDRKAVVFHELLAMLEFEASYTGAGLEPVFKIHYGGAQPAVLEINQGSSPVAERLRDGLLELAGVPAQSNGLDDD